jgi:hypothetical protein
VAAVLVHIDITDDRPHPSSMVALAAGRMVASSWGATLYAAVIATDPGEGGAPDSAARMLTAANVPGIAAIEAELAHAGADKIIVAFTDRPVSPLWAIVGGAWQGVLDHVRPRLVLFGADSPSAPELGPRTGARLGARLLVRAKALGVDDVQLRDRDGGYARADDGGAAVALIGHASASPPADADVDLVVLGPRGEADPRVELAGASTVDSAHVANVVVMTGDDVAADPQIASYARRLAIALGGQVLGREATPIAPELCIAIGTPRTDIAGASRLIQIGGAPIKQADGVLAGAAAAGLAALVERLETA